MLRRGTWSEGQDGNGTETSQAAELAQKALKHPHLSVSMGGSSADSHLQQV